MPLLGIIAFVIFSAAALHFALPSDANLAQQGEQLQTAGLVASQQVRQGNDSRQSSVVGPEGVVIEQLPRQRSLGANNDTETSTTEETADEEERENSSSLPLPPETPVLCGDEGRNPVFCIYIVQDGDTLSGIAAARGLGASTTFAGGELIALSNGLNLLDAFTIQPGQQLRVPLDVGIVHIVTPSEDVSSLAPQYGVTEEAIIEANSIFDPDLLLAGSALLIPAPTTAPIFQMAQAEPEPETTEEPTATAEALAQAEAVPEETPTAQPQATATQATAAQAPSPTSPSRSQAASPTATATPESTPTPAPTAVRGENPTRDAIQDEFSAGFRSVGGSEDALRNILYRVIPCESGYRVDAVNPAGPYWGLMQFLPATWEIAGGGDWQDPRQQGANTARLLQSRTPQTQWPHCW